MSPELETLDQLLGGELPLSVVRGFFSDEDRFIRGISAMLAVGEVRLFTGNGTEVPRWQWRELLSSAFSAVAPVEARLEITDTGARRIG